MRHLLLLAAFSAGSAVAADCSEVQGDIEHRECMAGALSAADKKLNATYASLRKSLDPESQALLVKAQKAWLSFRDSDCSFEADSVRGGSAYQSEYIRCQLVRTRARERQFRDSMHWQGDRK
ncbi:lysozyme inhibitor LprI family protein [Roseateles sp. P5_E8]